ncbi:MAG TPA: amino acid-binding protein [Coriobacteriia bacterium]|nr:amino acid-binding protein [Coriobacteriia bacterium]
MKNAPIAASVACLRGFIHHIREETLGIKQISAFVENQPGRFKRLTDILEKADVSIRGFSLADTADFGIVRLVVDRPEEAIAALEAAGVLVRSTDLICIELPDKPGALDHVFTVIAEASLNVEYAYSLVSTYIVLKVDDIEQAKASLADQPIKLVSQEDLKKPVSC